MFKIRKTAALAALFCSSVLNAWASADHMVIAMPQIPTIIEPQGINNNAIDRYVGNVFETLLKADQKTGELKPGLAESWRRLSPDTVEFKLRSVIGAGFGSLCCSFISFRLGCVDRLPSRHRKIQLDKTAFMRASIASDFTAVYPAAVSRSTRRLLHSKRAPLSYSLLRCQTVQRPLRWSQSTVLPEPPDSLHLPIR